MRLRPLASAAALALPMFASATTVINFDDVTGSMVNITNRYAGLGVTLNAISNPFPLVGVFPAPATLPTVLAGAMTWTDGFASASSGRQVAVSMPSAGVPGLGGQSGLLISFATNVGFVSMVGNDLGGCPGSDCESVTLTAYNAAGNRIAQTFTNAKLPGGFDRTLASISVPGIRYVAFNYTDSTPGFYAIDDLTFGIDVVPEPQGWALMAGGLAMLAAWRRHER